MLTYNTNVFVLSALQNKLWLSPHCDVNKWIEEKNKKNKWFIYIHVCVNVCICICVYERKKKQDGYNNDISMNRLSMNSYFCLIFYGEWACVFILALHFCLFSHRKFTKKSKNIFLQLCLRTKTTEIKKYNKKIHHIQSVYLYFIYILLLLYSVWMHKCCQHTSLPFSPLAILSVNIWTWTWKT